MSSENLTGAENQQETERSILGRLLRLAYAMNAYGKQRARTLEEVLGGSSETARQASPVFDGSSKIQSDLHGDMQSQAEMTWPLE